MAKNKISATPKNIPQKPQAITQATKIVKQPEILVAPIPYSERNFWIVAGIITVCAAIAYLPGFQNGYVWDDMFYIVNNEDLREVSFKNFKTLISDYYLGNWHPLTMVTYYIEYSLVRDTAWVYHFDNTIIHIINSILVFKLVEKLSKNFLIGAITAVLFAIHPLHVESVVWAAERKDVLYTLFLLLSFLQYLKYTSAVGGDTDQGGETNFSSPVAGVLTSHTDWRNKHLWYALGLFILSCLSKGMAVILPVVFLLTDYFLLNRKNIIKIGIEKAPFFAVSLITGIISIKAQSDAGANATKVISDAYSVSERFFMINYGVLYYWLKMVLPTNLIAFYPYPQKPNGAIPSIYFSAFAGVLALAITLFWFGRKNKLVWWGGLYFLIVIFPVSQVLPVGSALMADRYFYVSSIGPLLILAVFANYLYQKAATNKVMPGIGSVLLLALTFLSFSQSTKWKDTLTLFTPIYEKHPTDPMVTSNMGWYWFGKKDNEKAKFYFEETHKTTFKTADVHTALGQIYFDEKKYNLTVENFEAALKIKPKEMQNLHWMLGAAYYYTGQYNAAIEESQFALDKSDNKNQFAQNIMGLCLAKKGDEAGARKRYETAMKLDTKFADPYINVSTIQNHAGDHQAEIISLEKAIKIDPKASVAYKNLGVAYKSMGDWQNAIKSWERGIKADPKDGSFDYNIGLEYGQHGNIPSGIKAMQSAVAKKDQNAITFLTQRGIPLK
jgi:tetratricopeptide (TPR) repeat protein